MRRLLLLVALAGCGWGAKSASEPATTVQAAAAERAPRVRFAEMTKSPWPADEATTREAKLATACGERDAALEQVARALLTSPVAARDADSAVAYLRANGEPHLRPRVLIATGRAPMRDDVLRAQLESAKSERSRCAVAIAPMANGEEVVITIVVDALADLAPLPTRARTGEWLALEAVIHPPAEGAKVVILGPRGLPRTVPAALDGGRVRARFALDQPGAFTVQLVADLAQGPQPVLEARVFADVEPTIEEAAAPGEEAAEPNDIEALYRMFAAARVNLPAITRDPQLEAAARAHAERMRDRKRTAHDLGEGDLRTRLAAANIEASAIAENVAHARTLALAHRALYASPSHRLNMLGNHTRVGLGLAVAPDQSVYVCEVFAR